jgi:cell division septal protein FtsQ
MSARAATPAGRRRAAARNARGPASPPRQAAARSASAPPKPPQRKSPARRSTAQTGVARRPPAKPAPRKPSATKRPAARGVAPPSRPTRATAGTAAIARGWRLWAVVAAAAAALAIGYFAWFRDSSLVAVRDVSINGLGGGGAAAALTRAAEGMTTLHVDSARLESVAAGFPQIASVSIHPSFPHGLEIDVAKRRPVALARAGDETVPVARDGTILRGTPTGRAVGLPAIDATRIPSGPRLRAQPLAEARVLGATPTPLRGDIDAVGFRPSDGVTVRLRGGIELRFGGPSGAAAKWSAAAALLADPRLTSARYIDLRVPERPAVG